MNYKETRPWGMFENLLEDTTCKVKKITVEPGGRLSYQYHLKRSEVWVVVSGVGFMTSDVHTGFVEAGSVIKIPAEAKHRIENQGDSPLVFIEVQQGTYFGEDDIVRIEDDYHRLQKR